MTSFNLDPVERLTAGAIGEPGDRTFYVQASGAGTEVTLLAEKEQVRVLAEGVERLLLQLDDDQDDGLPEGDDLELVEPLIPEWRVGEMAVEYDELSRRVVITLNELVQDDGADEAPGSARFVATCGQARAMAEHALEVVEAGRPRCQFCGYPMPVDGDHACPAMNGHVAPRP